MNREERQRIRSIAEEVSGWIAVATVVRDERGKAASAAVAAKKALRDAVVEVRRDGVVAWRVMPLRANDCQRLEDIARYDALPPITENFRETLAHLTQDVAVAVDEVRAITGARRFFSRSATRESASTAAEFLCKYREWFIASGLPEALESISAEKPKRVGRISLSDALADRVGLARRTADLGNSAELLTADFFAGFSTATKQVLGAAAKEAQCRSAAVEAGNEVRREEAARIISGMPVDRLKEATRERIRTAPLTDAGLSTVAAVLEFNWLERLPGLGPVGATRIRGAAQTLWQTTYDETPARIDIKRRTVEATKLLNRLRAWDDVRKGIGGTAGMNLAQEMSGLAQTLDGRVTHAIVFSASQSSVQELRASVNALKQRAYLISGADRPSNAGDPWDDFLSRPADYFALLAELGFITEDEQKAHGDLSAEIVEAVRALELNTEYLKASLRGYQSFGARFALVQRKVIIGDEMGLGKTVEAIAVLAHLRAKGAHHFLVICPAAVVTNWIREVGSKSSLPAHRLHGSDRGPAARSWRRNGGVAVTTFETLTWLRGNVTGLDDLGCVVIDEAHYIKNPDALRTRNSRWLLDSCERGILLTGTPLENRLDEFRNLVSYLQPSLVVDANEHAPRTFRRQVAPAYLRRNQEDVLTELPEQIEVDEWLAMTHEDAAAYRDAVAAGNFMAMRQAAMIQGRKSTKIQRLAEIVGEAEDNERRVVVFSYFRDVLDQVAGTLPGRVFGPLTGSVPAAKRQTMIDEFSAAGHGAVLVAQIVAGGVGLNIQAASVVVICEPQFKPTTEWQAIARARRMGQLQSVQVHRLLSEEGVDQRIREILARKIELFEEFARVSETAGSAPEAYDVSEAELAREIIAAERERLFAHSEPEGFKVADVNHDPDTREELLSNSVGADRSPKSVEDVPEQQISQPPLPAVGGNRVEGGDVGSGNRRTESAQAITPKPVATSPSTTSSSLRPYVVFNERLPAIGTTPLSVIASNVARIVKIEGPLLGWRLHEVYKEAATASEPSDQFSRLLDRAISLAERRRLIVSDDPLGQVGNKARTYRLPGEPKALTRQLGPRTIAMVPTAELEQYFADVMNGASPSEEQLLQTVLNMLGVTQLTPQARALLVGACRTAVKKSAKARSGTSHATARNRAADLKSNETTKQPKVVDRKASGGKADQVRRPSRQTSLPTRSPFYDSDFVRRNERRKP
ncbi:DEAD/DEAH box helicase [Mycobacterium intracellulare]|uniref:DEAD/DEAH box helicase n=1 Tax=Mycobacterium intracellulare TaxID=1767 RepID=UPI000BAACA55|nr:DEAD/DEAH box helicase [Mycobacterium intracellulare]ASW95179.1 helicase SNF2 [Mycobacterium intracellulare]MCA2234945.1 DEAD/DEAH box helicase [Mycobacterium intracellulare]PBA22052.1 helicase SNF2 [Mycobacterium intracellulare]